MSEKLNLLQLRDEIDSIDDELLTLLNKRMDVVHKVGLLKAKTKDGIYKPEREKAIINRLAEKSDGLLGKKSIEAIFLEVFTVSRNLELPEKVAFLGPKGTYTDQLSKSKFGVTSEYLVMNSIKGVFNEVDATRAKFGVVPIENSSNGMVNDTLIALNKHDLKIISNIPMQISHIFATNCIHVGDVKKIYSKDIAFGQCREFLSEYGLDDVEMVPVNSTAKGAEIASSEVGSAVICSHLAAKIYNLPVLFENIEDDKTNKTNFVILSDFYNENSGNDNTAILAKLSNSSGSLMRFLKEFDEKKLNLIKIESHIISQKLVFYIELNGHKDDEDLAYIFNKYKKEVKILGSYPRCDNEV